MSRWKLKRGAARHCPCEFISIELTHPAGSSSRVGESLCPAGGEEQWCRSRVSVYLIVDDDVWEEQRCQILSPDYLRQRRSVDRWICRSSDPSASLLPCVCNIYVLLPACYLQSKILSKTYITLCSSAYIICFQEKKAVWLFRQMILFNYSKDWYGIGNE